MGIILFGKILELAKIRLRKGWFLYLELAGFHIVIVLSFYAPIVICR